MTKDEARARLLESIKPGDRIGTILRHRSRSGMSRSISLIAIHDGDTWQIDYFAGIVTGHTLDKKNGGIKIAGCGMDMGFEIVYRLGYALWPLEGGGYELRQYWL